VPLIIAHYTRANPDCAPPGHAVMTVMALAPWNYQDVWGTGGDLSNYGEKARYQQLKEQVADILLARAERHVPGLRAAICRKEISTPLTNAQFTLNRGGAVFGYEQSVEGMYLCRLNEETPIPNLFLTGAWTVPGGGQSAVLLSGVDAARHTLRYLEHKPGDPRLDLAGPPATTAAPATVAPEANGMTMVPGQPAPEFKLTAIGSGRDVSLESCAKRPLVLVFASQSTSDAVGEINNAVRARLPLAAQATVASVFDFGKVPSLFHGMIKLALKRAYKAAAQGVPQDFDPADYVMILPDWTGSVAQQFGIGGTDKAAAVVLVDRAGKVQGVLQGSNLADQTINVLQWM
jgi:hypothetical protein